MVDHSRFGRIGVLMGGPSSEREISLKSGKAVVQALAQQGFDVTAVDITTEDPRENERLLHSLGIATAFIALHGCFGEDGQVQQLLERLAIPYTGSRPDAHRCALDKTVARDIFIRRGLSVPEGAVVTKGGGRDQGKIRALGLPLVIKPATQGSSIGLSIIDAYEALDGALEQAFKYDATVLIEKYVRGRELTVGVLMEKPLPVIEIVPKRRFFDFEAKYQQGMTEYIVPAKIPADIAARAQQAALEAHQALGCSGFSRTDIIFRPEDNGLFVLEVNTIPGLTATSLLPKAAKVCGMEFPELCVKLLESAYEKK